jgi:DNA-binding transcriptional LysR family regulator
MRDIDLTSLRLFAAVCESGSIARAGEREGIAGSAISKRLAQLEHTVGTPLLVRRRRGVVPTAAGETLLEHAHAMLAGLDRIARDMAGYAVGVRGHVRLLATASVLAESLADDVADFLQQPAHRDIRIDMEERVSSGVVRGLREGSASLGICWDAAEREGLHWRPYRSDRLAAIVHPGHPLAGRARLSFADTLDWEHVGLPPSSAVPRMLQRAAAMAGKALVHRVQVSNFDAALRVVRAGLAISVLPAEAVRPVAAVYGLAVLPLEDAWARRQFAICLRDPQSLPPAAGLLLEHLQAAAGHAAARHPAVP